MWSKLSQIDEQTDQEMNEINAELKEFKEQIKSD